MNLEDADAGLCVRRLTELSLDEITSLDAGREENAAARQTQQRLAEELTRLVHGDAGLAAAQQATAVFFGGDIAGLDEATLIEIFAEVPSHDFSLATVAGEGLPLVEALQATGLASSRSQARRTIEQGGAYVNNRRIREAGYAIGADDLAGRQVVVLRSGKKSYALARFAN